MASDTKGGVGLDGNLGDRYRLLGKLGSGGMADVFLAVQRGEEGFERLVVMKKVHTRWMKQEESAIKMFIEEARTVASLSHPNIVKVFDLSKMGEDICIAMEYVDGENLEYVSAVLKKRNLQFPLKVACTLIVQACEALHYAHTAKTPDGKPLKLVHRDVGPHNIMLDSNGYLKIIDFGIAKSAAQGDLTSPGVIKGKLSYLAPDIFKFKDIDGRIDLYALGLVFYRLLTLKIPFPFKSDVTIAEVLTKILKDPLAAPSTVNPSIPTEFDAIIAKATHRDRDERYQSGEALADAIRATAEKHGGLASNSEVRNWFQEQFKARLAKRREFDTKALAKAKLLAKKEAEGSERPAQSMSSFTGEMRKAPQLSVPPPVPKKPESAPPRRRMNMAVILIVILLGLTAGAVIVHQVVTKSSSGDPKGKTGPKVDKDPHVASVLPKVDPDKTADKAEPPKEHPPKVDGRKPDPKPRPDKVAVISKPKPISPDKTTSRKRRKIKKPKPRPQPVKVVKPIVEPKDPPIKDKPKPKTDTSPDTAKVEPAIKPEPLVDKPPVEVTKPGPITKPKPDPMVADVSAIRWISGAGEWNGKRVITQGCARCHNGSKAKPFKFAIKTRRQWERFFKRNRHERKVTLSNYFSPTELKLGLKFILDQITKGKKSGIAGVK